MFAVAAVLPELDAVFLNVGFIGLSAFTLVPNRKEAFMKERGARDGVKKVMVIVTDGESHDSHNLDKVMADCETDGIERFGIAVSTKLPFGLFFHWCFSVMRMFCVYVHEIALSLSVSFRVTRALFVLFRLRPGFGRLQSAEQELG